MRHEMLCRVLMDTSPLKSNESGWLQAETQGQFTRLVHNPKPSTDAITVRASEPVWNSQLSFGIAVSGREGPDLSLLRVSGYRRKLCHGLGRSDLKLGVCSQLIGPFFELAGNPECTERKEGFWCYIAVT